MVINYLIPFWCCLEKGFNVPKILIFYIIVLFLSYFNSGKEKWYFFCHRMEVKGL
jgi:hypothetical protein